ncbi:CCC motif membrane protein [Seonamhaeicola sp. ML3]|uniref:CCC motif membrane protein n=1 Tax=Seonamhaeicola sp. ML3 TaxID=2937786 RepID=UPI00200F8B83|nr:CCC motif membrane protein [Seonamhaeicola sp. ML3]
MEQQKLPNATLVLVFGIISIVGCCFYGIGIILGIVALVLASKASKVYAEDPDAYSGIQNVKIGKVLSIIGIILSALYLILIIWMVMTFGWEAMQDQQLMQERIQEMMGQ